MEEAEGAQAKADGAAHKTEQEISKLSWSADGLAGTTEKSVQAMQDEMDYERKNRTKAINTERTATVKDTGDLIEKITEVTHGLANSAGDSANKQRALEDKVDVMKDVMEKEIEKTRQAEEDQLKKIQLSQEASDRTVEQAGKWESDMQEQMRETETQQEGILDGVDEEVDKTTAAAEARVQDVTGKVGPQVRRITDKFELAASTDRSEGNAALTNMIGDIDEQKKTMNLEIKSATEMQMEKASDVVDSLTPQMATLSNLAGQDHSDLEKYKNTYENQENEMYVLGNDVEHGLAAQQAQQDWDQEFVDTAKESTLQMSNQMGLTPMSFVEGGRASLDHLDALVKADGAGLRKVRRSTAALKLADTALALVESRRRTPS
jgi:hypothetical protein